MGVMLGVMPVQHALTCAVVQDALAEDPFEAGFTTCAIWVNIIVVLDCTSGATGTAE